MITGKPWLEFTHKTLEQTPDLPGVYEFGDEHRETIYIGSSGAEGLRTRLTHYRDDRPDPCIAASVYHVRYEVVNNNRAWQARLLEAYRICHNGALPPCNPHTVHEDFGEMLHGVETDKALPRVEEDLVRAVKDRGFAINRVTSPESRKADDTYRVFELYDPATGRPVQDQALSALPCLITLCRQKGTVHLYSIRPTRLLEMFGQDDLRSVAEASERVAIESMDEAAE